LATIQQKTKIKQDYLPGDSRLNVFSSSLISNPQSLLSPKEEKMHQMSRFLIPILAIMGALIGISMTGTGPGLLIGTVIGGLIGGVAGLVIRRL